MRAVEPCVLAVRMRAARVCALAVLTGLVAGSASADAARVVILPVVVHSGAADPTYVSRGLSDMLSARLEQHGGLDVVRVDDPALATSRLPRALEVGRDAGGDYVLFGSFTQFGDGASLDVQCAPLGGGGEPRSIFIQSGTMGEIIPKLDELADKVARHLGAPIPAPGGAPGAVADSSNGSGSAPTEAEIEDLRQRLEALERAVFAPVAGTAEESAPADPVDGAEALPES